MFELYKIIIEYFNSEKNKDDVLIYLNKSKLDVEKDLKKQNITPIKSYLIDNKGIKKPIKIEV